jgi:hypothetical protein
MRSQVPHHLSLTLCHNHHVVHKRQAQTSVHHDAPPPLEVERAALFHSLCRLKPFTLFFLSHLYLALCSRVYLPDLLHQLFAYSSFSLSLSLSLSLIHTNIFSVSTLSNAALKSTKSAHILPSFFFSCP